MVSFSWDLRLFRTENNNERMQQCVQCRCRFNVRNEFHFSQIDLVEQILFQFDGSQLICSCSYHTLKFSVRKEQSCHEVTNIPQSCTGPYTHSYLNNNRILVFWLFDSLVLIKVTIQLNLVMQNDNMSKIKVTHMHRMNELINIIKHITLKKKKKKKAQGFILH